jgi:hypothetical protein
MDRATGLPIMDPAYYNWYKPIADDKRRALTGFHVFRNGDFMSDVHYKPEVFKETGEYSSPDIIQACGNMWWRGEIVTFKDFGWVSVKRIRYVLHREEEVRGSSPDQLFSTLPAVIEGNGKMRWYSYGVLTRGDDLPSVIHVVKGRIIEARWYKDGRLHRDSDLPAVLNFRWLYAEWYYHGVSHRTCGPSVVRRKLAEDGKRPPESTPETLPTPDCTDLYSYFMSVLEDYVDPADVSFAWSYHGCYYEYDFPSPVVTTKTRSYKINGVYRRFRVTTHRIVSRHVLRRSEKGLSGSSFLHRIDGPALEYTYLGDEPIDIPKRLTDTWVVAGRKGWGTVYKEVAGRSRVKSAASTL